MEKQGLNGPRIALLIDFDNVILGIDEPGFDIGLVVNALRSRGSVVLGRAYGDWYRHSRHRRKLMEHGIELVETPAFGPIIKNSADIRIALDGFEIGMTQHHIQEFCLVSGDSDFLPLIKRLQYLGKSVVVIAGNKFTSDMVRRNCNEYISYENLLAESVGASEDATTLEGACDLLVRTINTLHERGMEVRSSTVKQMMLQLNPVFSERTFGCHQFRQFLDKAVRAGKIKLGRRDPNSGEYNVLLPSDVNGDDESPTEDAAAEEKPKRTTRRGSRKVSAKSSDENAEEKADEPEVIKPPAKSGDDLELADLQPKANDKQESSELEKSDSGSGENGRALRRGRLRFSGRTWKGAAPTRSILQGALEANDDEANTPTAQAVAEDGGVTAEPEITEIPAVAEGSSQAEEKPKRAPRRSPRKLAAKKAPAKKAAKSKAKAEEESSEEKPTEASSEAAETEPKKAAKKATRRRAPRKKKEDEIE